MRALGAVFALHNGANCGYSLTELRLPQDWNTTKLTWNGFCASGTLFPGVVSGLVTGSGQQHCSKSDLLSARSPSLNAAATQAQHNHRWDFPIQHFGFVFKMQLGRGMECHTCTTTASHGV